MMKRFANFNVYFWITHITLFATVFLYYGEALDTSKQVAIRRIAKELKELKTNLPAGYSVTPDERDFFKWDATIRGPADTPYAGGFFNLNIKFPADYPFKPPEVKFMTQVYHPNISEQGSICLDILKLQWSPVLQIYKVLSSISSLLSEPNPDDPLVSGIAHEYITNRTVFIQTAKHWTQIYAKYSIVKANTIYGSSGR